jgi:radical SAM superfamily enzyme YgiQ (UPF0313 family)
MRVALIRYHDLTGASRQLLQKRTGTLPVLGLGYIQSALKREGHDVRFFDVPALGIDDDELVARLRGFAPTLTGVTCTTPTLPGALRACELAKSVGSLVILGGPHTSIYGRENLVHDFVDFVGVGEGITIMQELVRRLEAGESPDGIVGLVTRNSDGGEAPYINLRDTPWPDRESMRSGRYQSILNRRSFATMITSRGCPYECSFCFRDSRKVLYRDAVDVVDEMAQLQRDFGVDEIVFYDDVFTLRKSRVHAICDEILRRGLRIRWEAPTRVDLVDEELLRKMAQAGCMRLRFGIESGSPQVLELIAKHSTVDKVSQAVKATKRCGIQTFGYFIVGYLGESWEQYRETIDFACSIPLDHAAFYVATPLPQTELYAEAVRAGVFSADYWRDGIASRSYPPRADLVPDAKERAKDALRRFYLRPKKVPLLVRHVVETGHLGLVLGSIWMVLQRPARPTAATPPATAGAPAKAPPKAPTIRLPVIRSAPDAVAAVREERS